VGPGADHPRQGDARQLQAAQAQQPEQPQAAGDAGRRAAIADRRERDVNERERVADERERVADQREALADRREREADEREEQLQGLIRELRDLVTSARRDALEAIESSLALLSASADRFRHTEEAVTRTAARDRREEPIARAATQQEDHQAGPSPAGQELAGRAKAMRARLCATVAAFAASEDNTAFIFDQLAASHPERASAYQGKAQQAREAADRAREISRELAG
jgi:hypothetical protein